MARMARIDRSLCKLSVQALHGGTILHDNKPSNGVSGQLHLSLMAGSRTLAFINEPAKVGVTFCSQSPGTRSQGRLYRIESIL